MPLVEVTIGAGRTPAQIRSLIHELHDAVLRTVDTKPEHVRVIVREVPRAHWATGDVTLSEMDGTRGTSASDGDDAAEQSRRSGRPVTEPEDEEQS